MTMTRPARQCRAKFLRFFPNGFRDKTYVDWERGYKWNAHVQWEEAVRPLLDARRFEDAAVAAVRVESRTNLLFSFEKMALRDAIKTDARAFARALREFLYGGGDFEQWVDAVESLPRRQTRVLTWPLVTVFGFIALPRRHLFLKPNVTRSAARAYDFELDYRPRPNLQTYESVCAFGETIRRDQQDLGPKDMIDLQSFMWVQGSDEYEEELRGGASP
jgi:hypothetical protein